MTTAQILRELRRHKHLSQQGVADALGIDRTTYVKYENGGSIKKNLQALANFFDVSTDYLLGRSKAADLLLANPLPVCEDCSACLNQSEHEHLKKYRALTSEHKGAIDNQLDYFYAIDNV